MNCNTKTISTTTTHIASSLQLIIFVFNNEFQSTQKQIGTNINRDRNIMTDKE